MATHNNNHHHPLPPPPQPGADQDPPSSYSGSEYQNQQPQGQHHAQAQAPGQYGQNNNQSYPPQYIQQQQPPAQQPQQQQYHQQYHQQLQQQQPQQQQQQQQQQLQQQPQYLQQKQKQPVSHQPQPPTAAATTSDAQRPLNQSRRSRGFSFRSDRSNDLHETSAEKEAKRLHSKADPTLAMNELEPSSVAIGVRSSLASVREIQHRDMAGQLITEPDRSNPTRWRFERPLATITAFQDAIDNGYAREAPYSRRHSTAPGTVERFNPRASMMASREYNRNSYYGNRPQSAMYGFDSEQPDEYLGPRQHSYGYPNGGQQPWPSSGHLPPRRAHPNRMSSEPQFRGPRQSQFQQGPAVYPGSSNQQSRETVASGSGSGTSGEQAGYQTDPTSDNSSIERKQSPPQPANDYGIGFSQPESGPQAFTVGIRSPAVAGPSYGRNPGNPGHPGHPRAGYAGYPPVPQKDVGTKGVIIRKPTATAMAQAPQRPAAPEKRKSWFGRHFSKKN